MDQEKDTTEQQAAAGNTPPPLTKQQQLIDSLTPEMLNEFKADLEIINTKWNGKIPFMLFCNSITGRTPLIEEQADRLHQNVYAIITGYETDDLLEFPELVKKHCFQTLLKSMKD